MTCAQGLGSYALCHPVAVNTAANLASSGIGMPCLLLEYTRRCRWGRPKAAGIAALTINMPCHACC